MAIYILSLIGSAPDRQAAAATGTISSSVVNIRPDPSTDNDRIGVVYKDTKVEIMAQAGDWYNIQVGPVSGWVHKDYVSTSVASPTPVTAPPPQAAPAPVAKAPVVTLDGNKMSFDVAPIIENGRILVPMAAIFRSMGATVEWNQSTRTVTAVRGTTKVVLPIDSYTPTVNGTVWKLDVPARIVGNRTLAPLRFVGEALGGTVTWDAAKFTAIMTSPPAVASNSSKLARVVAVNVGSSTVNLRGGPDTTYPLVGQANPGETLTVLGQQGEWYLVRRGAMNAWVAGWVVELIREGEEMPPSAETRRDEPESEDQEDVPVNIPSRGDVDDLETMTLSSERSAAGLKISMESTARLESDLTETSGRLKYVFEDRQLTGTTSLEKWLGAQKITAQGSHIGDDVQIVFDLPANVKYETSTENNGKREVLFIPNHISTVTRTTFGSSGESITVKGIAALGYTSTVGEKKLEVVFKNASLGQAQSSYRFSSPLISSLTFAAKKVDGDEGTVMTITTTKPAKFSLGLNDDGSALNVLFIDKAELQSREPLVVLDAGHGGRDPGASGNDLSEKDINLTVTMEVGEILADEGIRVAYTRDDDIYVALNDRPNIANMYNASVFVSIHCNSNLSPSPSGTETYCYYPVSNPLLYIQKDERYNLALRIQQELVAELGLNDRGVKQANFEVLRETDMPSALIEMGFISNYSDAAQLAQKSFQKKAAEAIAQAIADYVDDYVTR
ncbi:MAG: N-acetylmuramoyl-L-alanine amidase [Syntrophomonas sp.]|nr:N-acetylmuramoyl-L-alanine amidase [Syntrophomonas sp.]